MFRRIPWVVPRMTFSVTVSGGARAKCWETMPMPWRIASFGEAIVTGWSLTLISPSSAWYRPYRMRIKVVLPGAVLAKQGIDIPLVQGEIHMVVRQHHAKSLGNTLHYHYRIKIARHIVKK